MKFSEEHYKLIEKVEKKGLPSFESRIKYNSESKLSSLIVKNAIKKFESYLSSSSIKSKKISLKSSSKSISASSEIIRQRKRLHKVTTDNHT